MQVFLAQSGGGNSPNYVQIIVWGLLISISLISWIVKTLAQKREEANVRAAKRAREQELLRTGRTESGQPIVSAAAPVAAAGPASHDEARRRLQEIAQRRRAELEALARQSSPATRTPPPVAPARPTARPNQTRPLGPAGPAFPNAHPKPETQRQRPITRQDQRKKKSQSARPTPAVAQRPVQIAPAQQTLADKLSEASASEAGVYAVAPQLVHEAASWKEGVATAATNIVIAPATSPGGIDALRKALVLAEVLAPPVSSRPDSLGTTDGPLMRAAS